MSDYRGLNDEITKKAVDGLPTLPPHSDDQRRSVELANDGQFTFALPRTGPVAKPAFPVTMPFTEFWRTNTERLIAKYQERAEEYDSRDLEMVGHSMATAHNQHGQTRTEKEISGVLFYLQGKISRALSAMFRGKRPTADTCEDAFIYSMMLAYRQYLAEKESKEVIFCARDSDGDGNCQHCCRKGGCLAVGGPFP